MKNLGLFFCFALTLLFSQSALSQTSGKEKTNVIKALVVKNKTLEVLTNAKLKDKIYSISKKGVLTPVNGYEIRSFTLKKKTYYIITKGNGKVTSMDGTIQIGHDVFFHCFSDGQCDSCRPAEKELVCLTDGCPCFGEILLPDNKNIAETLNE